MVKAEGSGAGHGVPFAADSIVIYASAGYLVVVGKLTFSSRVLLVVSQMANKPMWNLAATL
jgi:hypothetical protein